MQIKNVARLHCNVSTCDVNICRVFTKCHDFRNHTTFHGKATMTYNLLPYFTSLSVLLQAQYKLNETNLNDTNVLLCNIKNKVGHIMSITTLDLIHQNLRCGKLFQTNNNFLECFQNYHAFILSKIVSHASSDVLSLLIPILDT